MLILTGLYLYLTHLSSKLSLSHALYRLELGLRCSDYFRNAHNAYAPGIHIRLGRKRKR